MQNGRKLSEIGLSAAAALALAAVTFLTPLLVFGGAGLAEAAEQEQVLPAVPSPVAAPDPAPSPEGTGELDRAGSVRVLRADGCVEEISLADYLWGVVAAEMPASFEEEALKAQAVAARTYTLWKANHNSAHAQADVCTDYTCCQAWISEEDAAAGWGENAPACAERITRAVTATDGQTLCYEGSPIQAVFHSSSAGHTEDAVAVWGSTVPYLVGVSTPEGEEVPNYHTTVTLTAEEVRAALEPLGCVLGEDPAQWFPEAASGAEDAASAVLVGGVSLRGNVVRTALGLRSPSFDVSCEDGVFTFSVTGYGHGVGLSQYGANAMAKAGKTWREIVSWYYTGVTIETWGPDGFIPAEGSDHPQSDGD